MSIVTFPAGIWVPRSYIGAGGAANYTSSLIDADDEGVALVTTAPRTGSIQELAFATATMTTTGDLDCRIETVSATDGTPTGTLWATNTNVLKSVADTDDNTWIQSGNFTANASVNKGDKIAIAFRRPTSGTFVGNLRILGSNWFLANFPYGLVKTGASWTKGATTHSPTVAVKYSDGTWEPLLGSWPIYQVNPISFNNASAEDEVGNVFNLPFPYRICGAWLWADCEATNSFTLALYDDAATPTTGQALETVTMDSDQSAVPTSAYPYVAYFSGTREVPANTVRRLMIRPETATNMAIYDVATFSSTFMALMESGTSIYKSAREKDTPGAWNNSVNSRVLCGLIIDGLDDGAGGGGGATAVQSTETMVIYPRGRIVGYR